MNMLVRNTMRLGVSLPGNVSSVGLELPDGLSFEEWRDIGDGLQSVERSVPWLLGDWARYGDSRQWGSMYDEAMEASGRSYQSVANAKSVAEKFGDFSRRREKLSFTHHAEVAALEPDVADSWLDIAEKEEWSTRQLREAVSKKGDKKDHNHRAQGTGENEWYTPAQYLDAAREVLGDIDLDPATSEKAQERVDAARWFTKEDDGLAQSWAGRVWLNPPYSQPLIHQFVAKLVEEIEAGNVSEAIMLTHNYTDTGWFHLAEKVAANVCFTRGRIRFEGSDGSFAAPTQGQAFFYFGPHGGAFRQVFEQFGFVR